MSEPDPFSVRLRWTKWDIAQLVIGVFIILPLRFFLIVVPLLVIGPLLCLLTSDGQSLDCAEQKPPRGWRKTIRETVLPKLSRIFLYGFGFNWINVKGSLRPKEDAPIVIIVPHTSVLDIYVLGCFAIPTVVSRTETAYTPLIGRAIRAMKPIFVSRNDKNSRSKALAEIRRRALSKGEWSHVVVFPEGTTTNGECVIHFKSGAFQPGLPVQPMLIKYAQSTMKWSVGGMHPLLGLMSTICRLHNGLEVEFLPVCCPTSEEQLDPVLFAKNTKEVVANALGVPETMYTYEDIQLAHSAGQHGLPLLRGAVEFGSLPPDIRNNFHWVNHLQLLFMDVNRSKTGYMTQEEMVDTLQITPKLARDMLYSFTRNKQKMSFREFVLFVHQLVAMDTTQKNLLTSFGCVHSTGAFLREKIFNNVQVGLNGQWMC